MHINGRPVLAGAEFEVHSPVDSSVLLGYFQKGTAEFARKALEAAYRAQIEMARVPSPYNDFDRMAINSAIRHLESAATELRCFAPPG